MKKILSLLLVMLFILAMEVGVYAENGDVTFTGLAGGQNIYIEPFDGLRFGYLEGGGRGVLDTVLYGVVCHIAATIQ